MKTQKTERAMTKPEVLALYAAHDMAFTASLVLYNSVCAFPRHLRTDREEQLIEQADNSMLAIQDDLHLLGSIVDAYTHYRIAKNTNQPDYVVNNCRYHILDRLLIWNKVHPERPVLIK